MDIKPKTIIRLDDGAEFVLTDNGEYALKLNNLLHVNCTYSYDRLINDPRNKGAFKVADGTEDLEAMRQSWRRKVLKQRDYCGHGDDDDI